MKHRTDRQNEIVSVAARLFREKGYSAVTMRDIAQAMDIKAASLYNHIRSKQQILAMMVIGIAEEYTNTIRAIAQSGRTSIEKIEEVVTLHIDITVRNADALAALNNDWMHLPKAEHDYFLQMREDYEQIFRDIINKGISAGEIRSSNPTLRTLYLWYGRKSEFSEDILRQNLKQVLLGGIS